MSHGVQRCDKVGDIVSKWKAYDTRRSCATCAWIRIARIKVLRVEGDVRCVDIADLVAHRGKRREK